MFLEMIANTAAAAAATTGLSEQAKCSTFSICFRR